MGFLSNFINSLTGRTAYLAGYGTRSVNVNADLEKDATCVAILDTNATHISRGQIVHVLKDQEDQRLHEIICAAESDDDGAGIQVFNGLAGAGD